MLNVSAEWKSSQAMVEKVENRIQLLRSEKEMLDQTILNIKHCTRSVLRAKSFKTETDLAKSSLKEIGQQQLQMMKDRGVKSKEDHRRRSAGLKDTTIMQKRTEARRCRQERESLDTAARARSHRELEEKSLKCSSMAVRRKVSKMHRELTRARQMELLRHDYLDRIGKKRAANQDCAAKVSTKQLQSLEHEEIKLIEALKESWLMHTTAQDSLQTITGHRPQSRFFPRVK
jgi:hypothetical protein